MNDLPSIPFPPELLEAIASHVAGLLADREPAAGASPYMTVVEAAEYLRWPRKRLYTLTAAGAIPHRKHEGRILFHRGELDHWLERYREGPRT